MFSPQSLIFPAFFLSLFSKLFWCRNRFWVQVQDNMFWWESNYSKCNESSDRHKVFLSRQTEIQPPFVDVAWI